MVTFNFWFLIVSLILAFLSSFQVMEYPCLAFSEVKIEKKEVNDFRNQLLNRINKYRHYKGLNSLTLDPCLNKVAQGHSEWMYAKGTLSHIWENGSLPQQRCADAGCICDSETIFFGSDITERDCFVSWLKSPEHNGIMLGNHTKIGIGIVHGWVTAVYY